MNCNEARHYLTAHLDEELDVMRDAEIVAHLDGCPACAAVALAHTERRGLTRDKLTRFTAPPDLDAKVRTLVRAAKKSRASTDGWQPRLAWLLPLAACFALAAGGGYRLGVRQTRARDFVEELTSSHVRALVSGHSIDVVSTDRHTVKPWFAGKLDFTPPVIELGDEGFLLAGGRLDHIDGRTVAVLVYERRRHLIDLYIAPANAGVALNDTTHAGFHLVAFTQGENRYFAVSDLAADELQKFSLLWQAKTP